METFLYHHSATLYSSFFFVGIGVVALWESLAPRRPLQADMRTRWVGNFGCLLLNGFMLWLLFAGWGIGASIAAVEYKWGLLHLVELPFWCECLVSFLLLDLSRYAIHWAFHQVPMLWRVHRLHHTDQDFDFTTAARFHPFEAVLEHGASLLVVVLLGPPLVAVMIFGLSHAITTCWVHGNIRIPHRWDHKLRWIFVTPEMHRTHHSQVERETNSNYGGLLSFWDRLFGNYVHEPHNGHERMAIGLAGFADAAHIRFGRMMSNPFLHPDPVEVLPIRTEDLANRSGQVPRSA